MGSLSIDGLLTTLGQLQNYLLLVVFTVIALWEHLAPRLQSSLETRTRWFTNLSLMLVGSAAARWVLPIASITAATLAQQHGWGLLNRFELPAVLSCVVAMLLLDLGAYGVHRLDHSIPLLWRLHQVHHADLEVDCTTSFRAHPIALIWEQSTISLWVVLIGAPPLAVALTVLLQTVFVVFHHGNLRIAPKLEHWLRWFIVTPDLHRIHHSSIVVESQRNLGTLLPWWDRWLGTYQAQPGAGQAAINLGLAEIRDARILTLWKILLLPFRRQPTDLSISR